MALPAENLSQSSPELQSQDLGVAEHQRLAVWFLVLASAVVFLILVGGTVRITDSGLSIPEWPIINGSLLPPFDDVGWQTVYATYYERIHGIDVSQMVTTSQQQSLMPMGKFKLIFAIEYFHRLMASVVSLIFLCLTVQVFRRRDYRQRLGTRIIIMGILLVMQAVLGGIVVFLDLQADFVAIHLGMAFLFLSLIVWTMMDLLSWKKEPHQGSGYSKPKWPRNLAWVALLTAYFQILSGGLVAATKAGYIMNTWPLMAGEWVPSKTLLWAKEFQPLFTNLVYNPVLVQFMHRWWAWGVVFSVVALIAVSLRAPMTSTCRLALRVVAALLVFQVMLGIMTLVSRVPGVLAITHLMIGVFLFLGLLWVAYEWTHHHRLWKSASVQRLAE